MAETVTVIVPLTLWNVAVMTALPGASEVTSPLDETPAIVESEDRH